MMTSILSAPIRRMQPPILYGTALFVLLAPFAARTVGAGRQETSPPIARYTRGVPQDAITKLQARIDAGEVKLAYEPGQGYLKAVLKALAVPTSSQVLVFSKTSVQKEIISPQSPRALYFNDEVFVGYVPTGPVLEIAAIDPQLGPIYYNLLQREKEKPRFFRNIPQCMECHTAKSPDRIPVHIMKSVYPDADGAPVAGTATYDTTSASPLRERWGGWYVTGRHGSQRHMGNCIATRSDGKVRVDAEKGANVTDLHPFVDTTPYLSPHSDIVALLIMAHQIRLQNLITRVNYAASAALQPEPQSGAQDSATAIVHQVRLPQNVIADCEELLRALLCVDEVPLTAPIVGSSGFAEQFARPGPRDPRGRSLRVLDLRHQLLRYPCSYMIYSEAYDALPDPVKRYLHRRLRAVLSGEERSGPFSRLAPVDCKAALDILTATKPGFSGHRAALPARRPAKEAAHFRK